MKIHWEGTGQPVVCVLLLEGGELPPLEIPPGVRELWERAQVAMGRFPALAAMKEPPAKSCLADSQRESGKSE